MPNYDAKAIALIAAGTATATYLYTKRKFEAKAVVDRKTNYAADQKVRFKQDEIRKEKGLPLGTKMEWVGEY